MNDKSKQSIEKLNGIFYTPIQIVDFLSAWANSGQSEVNVLEPSAGDGRFAKKIVEENKYAKVTAVELDSYECEKIKSIKNTNVVNDDFYNFYEKIKDEQKKYDIVIGNPPYIRYQFLSEAQREYQSDILKRNGMKPNKLINSWVAFTVASIELCKPEGKFAFVLPTDLLQVSYAKELRKFIFQKMQEVTIISFEKIVFSGIQQDVILLFGIKRGDDKKKTVLRNINIKDLSELKGDILAEPFESYSVDNSDKWRKFILKKNFLEFYDKKFRNCTISFNDMCTAEVGITTGNNKVFVVDNSIIEKYDLNPYKLPLLGRSLEVSGIFYTEIDIQNNGSRGRKVWILDFNNKKLNAGARRYIDAMEEKNEHTGYKLSLREKWYEVPSIWIPDAFLLRRIGRFPKLVKNEIDATSTDTFHRVKFGVGTDPNKLLVLFYSSPTLLTFELEGRVFGGGALEILPGDLKNIRLPKINEDLNFKEISRKLDKKLRDNRDIEEVVKWVDAIIQPVSEFSNAEIENTFNTWSKLRDSRSK